ncbi:hypothetical protein [Victivallis sp. Marseille-Q1083]|uniref:hypothetical protein n=1 Tax=Victivallis sp. Marseille-Q1083 TaxID=2717288 RepID=UPI00158F4FF5|nr:hypothetical protein [Victivallis sp. Marseille-Q1083]
MMKTTGNFFRMAFAMTMLAIFAAGCPSVIAPQKIPVEDIDVLTKFAAEIAVLQDRSLPRNSKEKYEAAKALADGVDFSYIRNVSTLEKIFDPRDVIRSEVSLNDTQDYIFYYQYGNHSVRFVFTRSHTYIMKYDLKLQ